MILAFDTSAAHCAVALLSGSAILASRRTEMTRGQAEALFPLLNGLLGDAGAAWQDITSIAVGTGPGNFTGIRIGVSAARGLAMSLGIPAIGVTSFEALASEDTGPVWATVAAPRDQVYLQRMDVDAAEEPELLKTSAAVTLIQDAALPVRGCLADPPVTYPDPEAIARVATRVLSRNTHPQPPKPFYVRSADAAPRSDPAPVILS